MMIVGLCLFSTGSMKKVLGFAVYECYKQDVGGLIPCHAFKSQAAQIFRQKWQ
jgi:hypothetical protein